MHNNSDNLLFQNHLWAALQVFISLYVIKIRVRQAGLFSPSLFMQEMCGHTYTAPLSMPDQPHQWSPPPGVESASFLVLLKFNNNIDDDEWCYAEL